MARKALTASLAFLVLVATAQAHDLFLRLESYFLEPNSRAVVRVLNGTFEKSDGAVARERLADLSLHGPGPASSLESIVWRVEEKTSVMEIPTAESGRSR